MPKKPTLAGLRERLRKALERARGWFRPKEKPLGWKIMQKRDRGAGGPLDGNGGGGNEGSCG